MLFDMRVLTQSPMSKLHALNYLNSLFSRDKLLRISGFLESHMQRLGKRFRKCSHFRKQN